MPTFTIASYTALANLTMDISGNGITGDAETTLIAALTTIAAASVPSTLLAVTL